MDFAALWDQVVQNIAKQVNDDKEKKLILMIGSQISIFIADNVLTFQCKSQYVSTLLPEYISTFFKEVKNLTGIQNLGMNLQPSISGTEQPAAPIPAHAPQPASQLQPANVDYHAIGNGYSQMSPYSYQGYGQNYGMNSVPTAKAPSGNNQFTAAGSSLDSRNQLPKFMTENRINEEKTFENYVTDPENKLIFAIAKKIAADPGSTTTNPFYIYGGSGLGKTHLLFAIANEIKKSHPEKTLIYMRAEEFIHNFVVAMSQTKSFNYQQVNFKDLFTSQDVFIVDDIQNFVKAQSARGTFFEIIADFIDKPNRQLILASDVPPGNLDGFNERLTSRFGSGVCREIYPPNAETRSAITLSKCREFHVELSDNIVDYIATHIRSNVREIEGAIKTLSSLKSINHEELTYDVAVNALKNLVNNSNKGTTIENIKERVAKEFDVSVSSMESAERKKNISNARSMAMAIANDLIPSLSLNDIGRSFNKDHSSVHEAIKRTKNRIEEDQEYNAIYQKLMLSLKKD